MSQLTPATIHFDEQQAPFSATYGDSYFSREDGLAESRYVFLEGNHLPQAWRNREHMTIAETGFGSGLNFLACWQAWEQDARRSQQLHFISIEKHPVEKAQLQQILAAWPELDAYQKQLVSLYPPLNAGMHTIHLNPAVKLTLYFMDISDALEQLGADSDFKADAWFLDGFAPSCNPDMWADAHLRKIYGLTSEQGTLATFTAASRVRKSLITAGFEVSKRKGFANKREMLIARKKK